MEYSLWQMIAKGKAGSSTQLNEFLEFLNARATDKLVLAQEYLDLATVYPVKIRSVIFHIRRMLKAVLEQYQLMEECLSADSLDVVYSVISKIKQYQKKPELFVFDNAKAKREMEALERKRHEEGKRKAYEARMLRKAKREGKKDPMHYLNIGAELPSSQAITQMKCLARAQALEQWKAKHSQHCFAFHVEPDGCGRGRACAFLHVELAGCNAFHEKEEVAG